MPVEISLDLSAANLLKGATLTDAQRADLEDSGALPGDSVWFRLVTQNDDRVRPSHRALHGTVWRVGDPAAPVPPMDYGCRCMIEYVAAPDTPAAAVLPPAEAVPVTPAEAYGSYLDDAMPDWKAVAKQVAKAQPIDQLPAATAAIEKAHPDWSLTKVRDFAALVVSAAPRT